MMIEKVCNLDDREELRDGLKQVREMYGEVKRNYIEDLSDDEMQELISLNAKLKDYEKIMRQETEGLFAYAQARVDDEKDIVRDFDVLVDLYFYLDEDDAAFHPDEDFVSDNIMTILRTWKNDTLKWEWGYGDDNCHNTIVAREGTILEHDKHCAVFHALYDHTELSYKEILRIGNFELDVKLAFEYKEVMVDKS